MENLVATSKEKANIDVVDDKQFLTDSVFSCINLLKNLNYIENESSNNISKEAEQLGDQMAEAIISIMNGVKIISEDELFFKNESDVSQDIIDKDIKDFVEKIDFQASGKYFKLTPMEMENVHKCK